MSLAGSRARTKIIADQSRLESGTKMLGRMTSQIIQRQGGARYSKKFTSSNLEGKSSQKIIELENELQRFSHLNRYQLFLPWLQSKDPLSYRLYHYFYICMLLATFAMSICSVVSLTSHADGQFLFQFRAQLGVIESALAKTTVSNNLPDSQKKFQFSAGSASVAMLCTLVALMAFRAINSYSVSKQVQSGDSVSFQRFSVLVSGFSAQHSVDKSQLCKVFERFGKVNTTYLVHDGWSHLQEVQQFYRLKQRERTVKKSVSRGDQSPQQLQALRDQIKLRKGIFAQIKLSRVLFAILTFESEEAKLNCCQVFKQHGRIDSLLSCYQRLMDSVYQLEGHSLLLSPSLPAPCDILLQNLDTSRSWQVIKGLLNVAVLIVSSSILPVLLAMILGANRPSCSLSVQNPGPSGTDSVLCYCLANAEFANMANRVCLPYAARLAYGVLPVLCSAAVVYAFNLVNFAVSRLVGGWMKFSARSSGLAWTTVLTTAFNAVNSLLVPTLLHSKSYRGVLVFLTWFKFDTSGLTSSSKFDGVWLTNLTLFAVCLMLLHLCTPLYYLARFSFLSLASYLRRTSPSNEPTIPFLFDLDLAETCLLFALALVFGFGAPILFDILLLLLLVKYGINNFVILPRVKSEWGLTTELCLVASRLIQCAVVASLALGAHIVEDNFSQGATVGASRFQIQGPLIRVLSRVDYIFAVMLLSAAYALLQLLWHMSPCRGEPSPEKSRRLPRGSQLRYPSYSFQFRPEIQLLNEVVRLCELV